MLWSSKINVKLTDLQAIEDKSTELSTIFVNNFREYYLNNGMANLGATWYFIVKDFNSLSLIEFVS